MGLPQSGGIADAAFHTKAEQVLLDPVSREQAGILICDSKMMGSFSATIEWESNSGFSASVTARTTSR